MAAETQGGGEGGGHKNGLGSPESRAQRERLIDAFTRTATEKGYAGLTVEEIAASAGLSEGVFYEHFSGKRQCLSAAYDTFLERMIVEARHAVDGGEQWPLQVKVAVAAGLSFVSETETRARFFAVDALGVGPLILERYFAAIERVVDLLRVGREHFPDSTTMPAPTERVLVTGVACLVSGVLLSEEAERLPALAPELVEILLTPYVGLEEAKRIAA